MAGPFRTKLNTIFILPLSSETSATYCEIFPIENAMRGKKRSESKSASVGVKNEP